MPSPQAARAGVLGDRLIGGKEPLGFGRFVGTFPADSP